MQITKPALENVPGIVSDSEVEDALHFLDESAVRLGVLTTEARRAESMTKHILALEMKRNDGSMASREMEARASSSYLKALVADAVAAGALQEERAKREVQLTRIEIWRTQSANARKVFI